MNTIIVDHDSYTEISGTIRFNKIIPLLRAWGMETLYTPWADQTLDNGIISPKELVNYIDSDYDIIYAVSAREPGPSSRGPNEWLHEISTEIPDNIIKMANEGRLRVAYFVGEILTLTPEQILEEVNQQLHFAGINESNITVYVPNFKVDELKAPHVKFISIFEMSYNYYLAKGASIPLKTNIIQTVNMEKRNKKFTCLNHLNKSHRLAFAASLFNAGVVKDGYFSYHLNALMQGDPGEYITTINANNFLGHCPFLLDTSLEAKQVNYHDTVLKPLFNDAYWNFVTESFFGDYSTVTEKTFKSIVNLQPFLIVGAPGSLQALRDLGYKTFDCVIDESYDYQEDHDRRMKLVVKVALQLANMDDERHLRFMKKIKPILEHNQQHFFSKHWNDFL